MRPFCLYFSADHLVIRVPVACWFILAMWLTEARPGNAQATTAGPVVSGIDQLARQRPDSAYLVIKQALAKATAENDRIAEGDNLQQLGLLFYHQGNYSQAINYLLQAQKLFRTANVPDRLARNLNELGTVYYYNRQSSLARKQFDEALTLYQQIRSRQGMARTYGNIGHLYEKGGDLNQAFRYQRLALANYQAVKDPSGLSKIYENLGSIYEDRAQYDSARYYYQKALSMSDQSRDEIGRLEIVNNLGDLYRKTGRYPQALNIYYQVKNLAGQKGERYQLNGAYRDLGKTYQLMNRHDSAYHYFELSHDLTDQIYATDNNRQIALLQTLYEVEQKDSEIAQLSAEKRINVILTVTAVLVLVLIGVLGAVVISRQRLKIQNEQALNQQNQEIFRTQNELMQAELTNKQLAEENLRYQLELKGKELTSHTLHLIQKNQVLEDLKSDLNTILKDDKRDQRKQLKQLVQKIGQSFSQDKNWNDFRTTFDQVHPNFFSNLTRHFPDLTATDLRLIALLKMNMNSADVATMLAISPDSLRVSRYRLRKKLGLAEGESLSGYIQRFV
ncbi:tetratricopeptide repeat protein [Fibrisoma montanum]|uniref:Tetratricopeptide repeat protein n=1 Tax=Fibrisoma montanum TaxID=2305895 RepID=A0A418MDX9_9BACT|nr:tetratricopeptide repeat protein [Fibrisoma montanum]